MDAEWYNAAAKGQIDKFKDYTKPLDLLRTPNKNTVLHVYITAVKKEPEESIEFVELVESKCPSLLAEPNIKGETPLHIAARFGRKNIVEFLIQSIKKAQNEDLERGAEASTSDKMLKKTSTDEDTALHEAVRNNHPQVVEILIRENPEFANIVNAAKESPLYLAAVRENNNIACKILEICPSPAYSGPNGKTALHEAVISRDEDLTRKILDKSNSLTKEQDNEGRTPLHYASYFNLPAIVQMLLEGDNKSAAYIGDNDGKTPLHIAIICGKSHLMVVEKIMSDCPDCSELADNEGKNVLHFAVESGNFKGVQIITEEPSLANLINQKDKEGNTPVHLAAAFGFESLTEHHLVDKKAVNNENLTALDVVLETKDETYELLGYTARKLRRAGYEQGRPLIQLRAREQHKITDESISELKKVSKSHQIVATLIATVTFTAGFTLPGGYNQDGPGKGTTILTRRSAFKAFLITDTLALALSISVVLIHFLLTLSRNKRKFFYLFFWAFVFTIVAMILMMVAFMAAVYAVMPHSSSGLRAAICVIGSCLALLCFCMLKVTLPEI
ncbi:hypothetical protein P3X46_024789 [Hevea brasiliensis]|uniref:PGG domain-containing protein n=1 Tax=Hevea brasiliensis TaxID=3981 RepID=A0ABQ9L6A0_HEVBR|nr:ankyrin repeat-containing protein At5g02620-like [Hevea brasiliensis]KAJ9159273.1 hypothetical protein P3X46_024789 [Hevea brasiliensis]